MSFPIQGGAQKVEQKQIVTKSIDNGIFLRFFLHDMEQMYTFYLPKKFFKSKHYSYLCLVVNLVFDLGTSLLGDARHCDREIVHHSV